MNLSESNEGYELGLGGLEVALCIIDFGFTMQFGTGDLRVSLRIESPFICSQGSERHVLNAEADPGGLGPALKLLHVEVNRGTVSKEGDLTIEFSDGTRLEAVHDEHYEAWTLNDSSGLTMVAGPDGRLSIFRPAVKDQTLPS
jgi:hypothetical protein